MVNKLSVAPFQVFDVLGKEDFDKVLLEKHRFLLNKNAAAWTLNLNKRYSDGEIGVFAKLCDKIKLILQDKGFEQPSISSLNYLKQGHRDFMFYHKHTFLSSIDQYSKNYNPKPDPNNMYAVPFEYFWVAIYYPHNVYEEESAGILTVRPDADAEGIDFKATPNSLVLHNALYGHEVHIKKPHPTLLRDAMFSHWLCKYEG